MSEQEPGPPGQQLILDLAHRPALAAEDFIVSASNAAAVAAIDLWPRWQSHGLLLVGPAGAGKSHLGQVWRRMSQALVISAKDADEALVPAATAAAGAVVEDIDRGIGDEKALFHLLNLAREQEFHLLFSARTPPGDWSIALPDLRSRLRALPLVHIGAPDEALLSAVLVKLLADRQLPATPAAVSHLARNMERSMQLASDVVAELDRMVWQVKREVTREMARKALATVTGEDAAGVAEPDA